MVLAALTLCLVNFMSGLRIAWLIATAACGCKDQFLPKCILSKKLQENRKQTSKGNEALQEALLEKRSVELWHPEVLVFFKGVRPGKVGSLCITAAAFVSSWIPVAKFDFPSRFLDPFADIPRTRAASLSLRKMMCVFTLRFSLYLHIFI